MDNRITKKRLNHVLSYEWVFMIFILVAVIIVWELVYSWVAVKPTPGQQFRMFYDYTVSSDQTFAFEDMLIESDTFSYEVLSIEHENVLQDSNVLSVRHELGICDAIITDVKDVSKEDQDFLVTRAGSLIDNYGALSVDDLILNAKTYLDSLSVDGVLSDQLIESEFRKRMVGDNRFKTEESILKGLEEEKARIEKIRENVVTMEAFLEYDIERVNQGKESVFYNYKRYSQALSQASGNNKLYIENLIESEKTENYGIKFWLLEGGAKKPTTYFSSLLTSDITCENLVLLVFDMTEHKKELQHETLSFVATLVRQFTGIN